MTAAELIFPDTTVLVNFALIDRMDLLEQLVNGRGTWCGTVSEECARRAERMNLPEMLRSSQIFGEPIRLVTRAEFDDYHLNLDWFASVSSDPHAGHEGESETLAIMLNREESGLMVTDDTSVPKRVEVLQAQQRISVCTTWDLLRIALWRGQIEEKSFWDYRRTLLTEGRGCPSRVRNPNLCAQWIKRPS
ncbi:MULTISPECIES: hypothetical protein [unclassified Luteococcus]|uniref:hypothetical protein n=1 Tax=unclassified Luteococcus TaxID=2639923 RepID=UPI00313E7398